MSEINDSKLFLLGETHGVQENPNIIYTLFKKFKFENLALEWNDKTLKEAERFLQLGKIDFESLKSSADGRVTAGHFALLKKLQDDGLLKRIICFDQDIPISNWKERDSNMAQVIINNLSENRTLVVAGNLHIETVVVSDEKYHPMSEIIKRKISNVPHGEIKYLTGEYYNFGVREFRKRPIDSELPSAKFYKLLDDKYVFELPEAHAANVPDKTSRLK